MPDSVPGPKSASGRSGNAIRTWRHFVTFPSDAGSHIRLNSPRLRQLANVFAGFVTMARLSNANGNSMSSTPVFSHCASSAALMGRDAPAMSISPAQNFLKPPPVPDSCTFTLTEG